MRRLHDELGRARRATGLTQEELAARAGLSRLTVHRVERGEIDPRLSTFEAMARALGMELVLVPAGLRAELESFVRAGGRVLGVRPGLSAPRSIVEVLMDAPAASADRDDGGEDEP